MVAETRETTLPDGQVKVERKIVIGETHRWVTDSVGHKPKDPGATPRERGFRPLKGMPSIPEPGPSLADEVNKKID